MAVVSWKPASYPATAYVSMSAQTIEITSDHTEYNQPLIQVKANVTNSTLKNRYIFSYSLWNRNFTSIETGLVNNNTYTTLQWSNTSVYDINTASYFKESNKTSKTVELTPYVAYLDVTKSNGDYLPLWPDNRVYLPTVTLILNVPPTATVSALTTDTPYIYAGLTTASVTVTDATAYYGGDIDSITMTIGEQTVSIVDDTIEIPLNASGTFTPVVTVIDSRGQTKDYQLNDITVNTYNAPTVNFDAERTINTGILDDEGTYATLPTTLTFDPIAEAVAPSVSITDENGNVIADEDISITWYSTRASSGALSGVISNNDWSTVTSGSTIYGLISITGGFSTVLSYTIAVTPEDNKGTGTTITDILSTAFYTVDFLAGGHGIAFGQPCAQEGFFCNMDAHFIDYSKVMHSIFDIFYPKGSYYETHLPYTINGHSYDDDNLTNSEIALCGDTWFDPRIVWGGTWILETEGQVHVSAGTNYTVAGALTNTSDDGEATHTLTIDEMPSHRHYASQGTNYGFPTYKHSSGASRVKVEISGGDRYAWVGADGATSADASALEWTSSLTTAGEGAAHENMPPYIVVYRWHRTA